MHVAAFDVSVGLEATLADEMAHAALRPSVPQWVQEGVAGTVAWTGPLLLEAADV